MRLSPDIVLSDAMIHRLMGSEKFMGKIFDFGFCVDLFPSMENIEKCSLGSKIMRPNSLQSVFFKLGPNQWSPASTLFNQMVTVYA